MPAAAEGIPAAASTADLSRWRAGATTSRRHPPTQWQTASRQRRDGSAGPRGRPARRRRPGCCRPGRAGTVPPGRPRPVRRDIRCGHCPDVGTPGRNFETNDPTLMSTVGGARGTLVGVGRRRCGCRRRRCGGRRRRGGGQPGWAGGAGGQPDAPRLAAASCRAGAGSLRTGPFPDHRSAWLGRRTVDIQRPPGTVEWTADGLTRRPRVTQVARGTSGLRRAGWWVTPTRGNPQASATENRPPACRVCLHRRQGR